jgi:uncharacterized protein (DUF1684 family)
MVNNYFCKNQLIMNTFLAIAATLLFTSARAQQCSEEKAAAYQEQLNKEYADPAESPLTAADLAAFKSLDFYAIDMRYCVVAKFVRTPNEKPFDMPTTTTRKPVYVKFGEVYFLLEGKECKLDVFQNIELVKKDEYKNSLFLPFTDATSGETSYGGGRYIDLKQPEGDTIVIDFNTAYNPYCVYNHKYSCPIPPSQNDLDAEVKAGVMMYKH